jgi:rubrerythrin
MEATATGMNRTGAKVSPLGTAAMTEAVNELTPPGPVDTSALEAERITYINEADTVGSIPPPTSLKGVVKTGVAKLMGGEPTVLLDKLGERLAYERSGVRLYEALIVKHQAVSQMGTEVLPPAAEVIALVAEGQAAMVVAADEPPAQTLLRIRNEEHAHFVMLGEAIQKMGGDPTSQTPCADVTGTMSMGFWQVLSDPRTTLAQCLNAMLAVELTDNAGWELLIQLADEAGETELSGRFLAALTQEQEHLAIVKGWVTRLVKEGAGTPAV